MIVDCAVYEQGRRRAGELPIEHACLAGRRPGAFVWIGLYEPSEDERVDAPAGELLDQRAAAGRVVVGPPARADRRASPAAATAPARPRRWQPGSSGTLKWKRAHRRGEQEGGQHVRRRVREVAQCDR